MDTTAAHCTVLNPFALKATLCLAGMFSAAAATATCTGPGPAVDATAASVADFVKRQNKQVLTFAGFSGAGYEDPEAVLRIAARVLQQERPARTLINIGATAEGIGQVYALAHERGFTTMGIVSSLARDSKATLSPCVDHVFFVADTQWGGLVPGTRRLSPTSAANVAVSRQMVVIGGGDIARDEALAARRKGTPVRFHPADMHHQAAREKAAKDGQPMPTAFSGPAHAALAGKR
jgi:hypothetical protein